MPVPLWDELLSILSSFQRCHPCIFRMCVLSCASLRREVPEIADFRDLVIFTVWDILVHDAICPACFLVIRASFEDDQ